jgi:hypothetical protein
MFESSSLWAPGPVLQTRAMTRQNKREFLSLAGLLKPCLIVVSKAGAYLERSTYLMLILTRC